MQNIHMYVLACARFVFCVLPASAAPILLYNNDTPTNAMAMASRPGVGGKVEIEAADDFILTSEAFLTSGTFTGLLTGTSPTVGQVTVEIYRVFPLDSTNPPDGIVPTRTNSPSDVEFADRSTVSADLTFTTSVLAATFTALNSVLNGIHPGPPPTTGGEGPVTGQEVGFNVNFLTPMDLPAGHYFFIPQVAVTGGEFFWLSASRPISGAGTTPIIPDLQAWIRNANLDPDWLRVGTDIVGGATPPTFNAAFSLTGNLPEPSSIALVLGGLALLGAGRFRLRRRLRRAAD